MFLVSNDFFSMGLLKLYGIARPLHYIHHITMNKCVKIVVFSWLAFFTLVTITMIFTALTKISVLADWTNCTMEKCLKPIYRVRNALTAIVYFFTIFCFLITVCLIRRANKLRKSLRQSDLSKSRSYHSSSSISTARCGSDKSILQSKHKIANKKNSKSLNFPLVKLALNVGTLAIFHFPYTVWAIFLTFAPTCYFTFHWTIMQSLMGYVRFSLLFRIVLDSCMGIWMDKQMRNSLRQILGMAAKHSSSHSSNRMSSSISESALDNRHLSVGCKIDPLRVASLRIPPSEKCGHLIRALLQ
uniref:G-protein coupled receptors family 1 profile domain-containing protein n=1 Tax=Ditylenchus dipsaci TaxID=166011 RepID=A0A915D4C0_9BILA